MEPDPAKTEILSFVVAAVLALLAPAGIATFQIGLVRAKNAPAVGLGKIGAIATATLLMWAVGYLLIAGVEGGWGGGGQGPRGSFLSWLAIALVGACVIGGAAAERMRFRVQLVLVALYAGVAFPLFTRWTLADGWLHARGFIDEGGATKLHALAGWMALALAIAVGPRNGRFGPGGRITRFDPGSPPLVTLGLALLLIGLLGPLGGPEPRIMLHELLSAAGGGLAALVGTRLARGSVGPTAIAKGALAGVVALSAGAELFPTPLVPMVGVSAGLIVVGIERLLDLVRVDDATATVAIHAGGGLWGALALALVGDVSRLGMGRVDLLIAQLIGAMAAAGMGLALGYGGARLFGLVLPLRVSREQEQQGLAVAEHHVASEAASGSELADDEVRIDVREEAPVEPYQSSARFTFDQNGIITGSNPLASAIFGYGEREFRALPITALFAPRPDAPWDLESLAQTLGGARHIVYAVTRGGEELAVEAQLLSSSGEQPDTLMIKEADASEGETLSPAQLEIQDRLAREFAETELVPSRDLPADALLPGGEVAARVSPSTPWFGYYYDPKGSTVTFFVGEVLAEGGAALLLSGVAGSSYGSDYTHGVLLGNARYPVDRQLRNLAEVMNRIVLATGKGGITIGMSFLHVNMGTGEAMYLSAGHRQPILLRTASGLKELEGGGAPLGGTGDPDFVLKPLTLSAGDSVVLWSDGMVDAFNAEGEVLSYRDVRKLVQAGGGTRELRDTILAKADEVLGDRAGAHSVLVFRYTPR